MKKSIHAAAAAVVAAALTLPAAAQDLVLGLSHAKTGRYATASKTEIAVDIAVAEINAAGGVNGKKLRVEKFDTASEARNAQIAVQHFAEDTKALAVIGPFSSQEAQVAFAAGERLEIVQMPNASSAPGMTVGKKWAFRLTEDEGKQFTRLLISLERKGLAKSKTAAVFYPTDDAVGQILGTKLFPALLKKHGWTEVIPGEGFPFAASDLSPQVTKLRGKNPDIIAFGSVPEPAAKLMREARRQGFTGRLVGGGTIADPDLAVKLGADGEGAVYVSWYWWDFNDMTRNFEKKFIQESKSRNEPRTGAHHVDAAGYDIVYVYADAMRRAKITGDPAKLKAERDAIRAALATTDLPGVSGHICFDKDREAELAGFAIGIKDGKRYLVDSHPSDKCN